MVHIKCLLRLACVYTVYRADAMQRENIFLDVDATTINHDVCLGCYHGDFCFEPSGSALLFICTLEQLYTHIICGIFCVGIACILYIEISIDATEFFIVLGFDNGFRVLSFHKFSPTSILFRIAQINILALFIL